MSLAETSAATGPEYLRRRTFAIISHPDAGKTTLTEKLLLCGGAIRMAGQVRARGERRRTRSDWMKIEQDRGISVSSTVMTFERGDMTFNLLDTPGHEDFSEDTYRTLTAVDAAVMVIDTAKGIEPQTRKLFEVCRLRDIPILTFMNKIDREARDPFELIDEVQEELALDASPMMWPLGSGSTFQGCIHLKTGMFLHNAGPGKPAERIQTSGIMDEKLDALVDPNVLAEARDNVELAAGGYTEFDHESFLEGHLSPVIFGSALRGFGVEELLDVIAEFAPPPQPLTIEGGKIGPEDKAVSGFVFKVQANMDPNHRDRIAFLRLVSGHFKRGMKLKHGRTNKAINIHSPLMFFAQDRQVADDAFPGDVIGIPNHGTLRVGDTLSEKDGVRFTGLPAFAPEILRRVRLSNTSKTKQLRQGLRDLAEEGLAQVFIPFLGSQWIVGVVGILQLDVMVDRIGGEYGAEISFEPAPFVTARWVSSDDKPALEAFRNINQTAFAEDRDGAPVYLARSQWELDRVVKEYPEISFKKTREL